MQVRDSGPDDVIEEETAEHASLLPDNAEATLPEVRAATRNVRSRLEASRYTQGTTQHDRQFSPEEKASLLSKATFSWMNDLIKLGSQRALDPEDLYPLANEDKADSSFSKVVNVCRKRLGLEPGTDIPPGFFHDLHSHPLLYFHHAFGRYYYGAGLLKVVNDIMVFLTPILVYVIVDYVREAREAKEAGRSEGSSTSLGTGLLYVLALLIVMTTQTISIHHYFARTYRASFWVESSLMSAIYHKALRLRINADDQSQAANKGEDKEAQADSQEKEKEEKAKQTATVGEMVNRMSVDASRVGSILIYAHSTWSSPFQMLFACGMLYQILGPAAASAGVFTLFALLPLNIYIGKVYSVVSDQFMEIKDERTKFVSEVIRGIQAVKYYAWENKWRQRIMGVRKREFHALRKASYVDALSYYVSELTPVLVALASFGTYAGLGNTLDAPTVFATIAVFEILRYPIMMWPWLLTTWFDSVVSMRRISKFLVVKELDALQEDEDFADFASRSSPDSGHSDNPHRDEHVDVDLIGEPFDGQSSSKASNAVDKHLLPDEKHALVVKNGVFTWGSSEQADAKSKIEKGKAKKKKNMSRSKKKHEGARYNRLDADHEHEANELLEDDDDADADEADAGHEMTTVAVDVTGHNRHAHGHGHHHKHHGPFKLNVPSLRVPHGALVYVIGSVGSGKTSLLHALFGEMHHVHGSVVYQSPTNSSTLPVGSVRFPAMKTFDPFIGRDLEHYRRRQNWLHKSPVRIAYASQSAWLENASVKDNILFGHEYDETRFSEVIRVCALSDDISILPAGIHTEIGESGVNLSGGQKARIALARAVYADADVYLLDSPLAAVDAHVASHIHRECILGMLKGKTRIMATHAVQFASDADMVVKLRHGRIVDIATGQSYASISGHGRGHHRTDTGSSSSDSEDMGDGSSTTKDDEAKDKEAEDKKRDAGRLVAEEERQIGGVRFAVMWKFFRYCGLCLVSLVMLFSIAAQILKVAGDFYLASWTERSSANSQDTQDTLNSLLVYGLLGLGFALCVLIRSFLFYQGSLYASTGLHDDMLTRVLRAPLMFFQTTPSGRLLNRFAKDQMAVDWDLPGSALSLLGCVLRVIGVFLVICIVFPLLLLVLVPVFGIYLYVEKLYRKTVLSVKRIESTSRSPIFSHFSTSLRGMSVIRAFGHQTRFLLQNESFIDGYLRPAFISIFLNRWLGQRLEFVGNTIVFATTLLAVLLRYSVDSAQSGLAITYALSVTGTLNWLIRMLVMTEANFTSVERIVEYTEIPVERPPIVRDRRPPSDWPRAGQIEIRDLCIRYRPGLPLALNHVSVFIHAGEKIGVVGRTGSGKSSLVSSLFRLIEFETGSIIVDGVDIRNIGLDDLRSRFTIIPQDPVIFSGTVRMNLDPFGDYEDQRLWAMLEAVQLKDLVSRMPLKLEQPLSESGGNLSVGEAQLLCLARALLRKSRVFVQDEASANIDYQSDQRIQDTIRKECADCTVITIAHRLGTIMDSDRILVLDDGKVAEFDRPAVLATDPSSRLFGLIQATGPENAALLTAVAKGEKKLFGEGAIEDHDRHV